MSLHGLAEMFLTLRLPQISFPGDFQTNLLMLFRWVHLLCGITWLGLLYFFNLVGTPTMNELKASARVQVFPALMSRAMLWFRWSALLTWLMGAYLLSQTHGRFVGAFTLGLLDTPVSRPNTIMGVGAWLGTIMLFNVWGLIWPNQKKILGIVPATDEQKASARKVALYASRTNFLLSVPMLMCMVGPTHGLPF